MSSQPSDTTRIGKGVATNMEKLHHENGVGTGNMIENVLAKNVMSQGMICEGDNGASMSA